MNVFQKVYNLVLKLGSNFLVLCQISEAVACVLLVLFHRISCLSAYVALKKSQGGALETQAIREWGCSIPASALKFWNSHVKQVNAWNRSNSHLLARNIYIETIHGDKRTWHSDLNDVDVH